VKVKLYNLSSQCACQTFAMVRLLDNCIKIVYSLSRYVAPLTEEGMDRDQSHYFAFKGDCTRRNDAPPIQFRNLMLNVVKYKLTLLGATTRHYE